MSGTKQGDSLATSTASQATSNSDHNSGFFASSVQPTVTAPQLPGTMINQIDGSVVSQHLLVIILVK